MASSESHKLSSRRSYWRKKTRENFVEGTQKNIIMQKIDEATTRDKLDVIKDFFKSVRTVQNPKSKTESVNESFAKIEKFLDITEIDDSYQEQLEVEFWDRYSVIASEGLSERVWEIMAKFGYEAALNFMDTLGI